MRERLLNILQALLSKGSTWQLQKDIMLNFKKGFHFQTELKIQKGKKSNFAK